MLLDAVRNGTVVRDQSQFGQQYAVVHVGDIVEVDWTDEKSDSYNNPSKNKGKRRREDEDAANGQRKRGKTGTWQRDRSSADDEDGEHNGVVNRSLSLNCVVCSEGIGDGSNGLGVFGACGNCTSSNLPNFSVLPSLLYHLLPPLSPPLTCYPTDTQSAHISTFYTGTEPQPPRTPFTLPSLNPTLTMPDKTVGICFFSLGGDMNSSFSVPFPVAQAQRIPHWRFNENNPIGYQDSSIVTASTATATPGSGSDGDIGNSGDGLSGGAIAGVVMGVVGGIAVFAVLAFFWWRRRKVAKGYAKEGHREVQENRQVELQRVERGGVARRVERDEDGDAPPAYHEVVNQAAVKDMYG